MILGSSKINTWNIIITYGHNEVEETTMVYGYARVSTTGQATNGNSLEEQEQALREQGCDEIVVEQYTGTKTERPKFSELLEKLQRGDTLKVTKLDRFARNTEDGGRVIKELLSKGVKVHILNMGVIDDSPVGRVIYHVFLTFAEFERDMIVERTQAGKAVARTKAGFKEGRPEVYSKEQKSLAVNLLLQGNSYTKVSAMTGLSKSTLTRAMREYKAKK